MQTCGNLDFTVTSETGALKWGKETLKFWFLLSVM